MRARAAIVMAAAVLGATGCTAETTPAERVRGQERTLETEIVLNCRKRIESEMRAPQAADWRARFDKVQISPQGTAGRRRFTYTDYVDGVNAFGGPVRTRVECVGSGTGTDITNWRIETARAIN